MLVFIQIPFKYKNQDVSVCLGSSNRPNTKPLSGPWITPTFSRGHRFAQTKPRLTFGTLPAKEEQEALLKPLKRFSVAKQKIPRDIGDRHVSSPVQPWSPVSSPAAAVRTSWDWNTLGQQCLHVAARGATQGAQPRAEGTQTRRPADANVPTLLQQQSHFPKRCWATAEKGHPHSLRVNTAQIESLPPPPPT